MPGSRTVVVERADRRSMLPSGDDALPVWSLKTSLKWDYAEMLAIVLEVYFSYDYNQSRFVSDYFGLNIWNKYVDPEIVGLNLMAQARF